MNKNFVAQKFSIDNDTIEFKRTTYNTYIIVYLENNSYIGRIEEDTDFNKINSVYEFLRRKNPLVWKNSVSS
jgi:hypothetical protein